MRNIENKMIEFDKLNEQYNQIESQYEKDKFEIYSILLAKMDIIKRDILVNNVSNYDAFDYTIKLVTSDTDILKSTVKKLIDDQEIIDLLFKHGIIKEDRLVSVIFFINNIIASIISTIAAFITVIIFTSSKNFEIEMFGIFFIFYMFIFVSYLYLAGSVFTFEHFHFGKKEK